MNKYAHFSKKNRRLQGYDYRLAGWYFITICVKDREMVFGNVKNGRMELSDAGQVAHDYWLEIPKYKPQVILDEFVVMPNHMHGLLGLEYSEDHIITPEPKPEPAGMETNPAKNQFMANLSPKAGSISRIIGSYKAACTKMIRSISNAPFYWQEHFYDHIIRNEQDFARIAEYIRNNPKKWAEDKFYKG